jgi:nucleoside-diphosphate-sugar epimerase
MTAKRSLRVLVLGASGFIGSHLAEALEAAGYDVVLGIRSRRDAACRDCVEVDYTRDHTVAVWMPRLAGIDVVVNAVGILRETRGVSFDAVHVKTPIALFEAAAACAVAKIVQISALGADRDAASGYHLSKKRADDALSRSDVPWTIVQPSLVFGEGGASAALFTTLAALPLIPVPGDGGQRVQPIHIDDLTEAIVRLLESEAGSGQRIAAVGPQSLTVRAFLQVLRDAMGLGRTATLHVPMIVVRAAASLGDHFRRALLDTETLGMLLRGNTASSAHIVSLLGRTPRAPASFVDPVAAQTVATRAKLAWLLPILRVSVALVWIVTGIVSMGVYPVEESYALLARVGLTGAAAAVTLYGAALLDLFFGVAMMTMHRRRRLYEAQMVVIGAYTAIITLWLPEFWAHPYGPVLKNLPILAGIFILHELEHRSPPQVKRRMS